MNGFATVGAMAEVTEQQPRGHCLNCGATLAGDYCSQCGQRDTGKDLRFADLLSELVGEFFTWDSRIWRTLVPLLVRPGFLTAEFMAGRRARYVPPLRLYLIISFALFLALSFGSRSLVEEGGFVVTGEEAAEHLDPNDLAKLEKLEQASGTDLNIDLGEGEGAAADMNVGLVDSDSPRWLQHLEQRIKGNAGRVERDPQAFVDQLVEYLPQMMFLLLPVFALLLKLCYLFSPYHYLQHLVFSLNYHSFVFLLYIIGIAVERFAVHYDGLFLALLVYLPVGLWRAYGTGPAGAIGRAALIYLAYGILLAFAFGLVAALALLLM